LSYATDDAVRAAFTISTYERAVTQMKTAQFWRSLDAAKKLAAALKSAYQ
jgi:hypothetical protein